MEQGFLSTLWQSVKLCRMGSPGKILLCDAIGIIIPILVICIVYLVINQIWTSVVILLGSISIAFIILVLFSKLIFAIRNII